MRKINKIIIHCTDTLEGRDYTVADIRRWHTAPKEKGGNGWNDIGYHYIIYRDGTIMPGRAESVIGAHVSGHNSDSIGICYVGGKAIGGGYKDTRTPQQKEALLKLLTSLRAKYPTAKIYGHRDFAAKACPCFDAKTEYANL